jgi:ribosomal protein S18 acetylase RimI-like enzyme
MDISRPEPAALSLREATEQDAATLLRVMQAAFAEYLGQLDPPSGVHRETVESIRQKLQTGRAALALIEDEAVGCVFYRREQSHVYLSRLSVLPRFRNRGVGAFLIRYVESYAAACRLPCVQLGVRLRLPHLLSYYERLGYRVVEYKAHEGYAEPTYVLMEKRIGREET